jgi:hypothetical protein
VKVFLRPRDTLFYNSAATLFSRIKSSLMPLRAQVHPSISSRLGLMRLQFAGDTSAVSLRFHFVFCEIPGQEIYRKAPFAFQIPPGLNYGFLSPRCGQYKIELRMRNHSVHTRPVLIQTIAACVPEGHTVALENPEVFILVEVFKASCRYFFFRSP